MTPKRVVLLGATGSIGKSTLRVIRANRDRLQLVGIAGHSRYLELAAVAREFGVSSVAIYDPEAYRQAVAADCFHKTVELMSGMDGLVRIASEGEADVVVVAIVGTTGLHPSLAAIRAGRDIALASKEVLVMAGKFVTAAAREKEVSILPIDSEHNALFQCMQCGKSGEVARIIITASGGPFREYTLEQMRNIQPKDAVQHPNWSMGTKITVDSSTMANKGLELIEARWLFDLQPDQIEVVVHPQSIIHSMVEYVDGSIMAQLSPPSMTFAIQNALLHPDRTPGVEPSLDFGSRWSLHFEPPDLERFPCLRLARECLQSEGIAPTVFNAANEVAVAGFMDRRISYLSISRTIAATLSKIDNFEPSSLDELLEADFSAREIASEYLQSDNA